MIKIKQAQPQKNIDPNKNQKISTIQVNKEDKNEDGDDDGLVQTKIKKDKKPQFQAPVANPQQEQLDDKPINLENFGPGQQKSQPKPQVVNEGFTVNKAEFPTLETAAQEKISKKKQKELIEANKLKDQQVQEQALTNNGGSLFTNSRQGNQPLQQGGQQQTKSLNFSTPIQFSNAKKEENKVLFEAKTKEIVTQSIQRSAVPIAKEEAPAPIIQFQKSQLNLAEKTAAPVQQTQPTQPTPGTQPKIQRSQITREQMLEQEKQQKQQEQPKGIIQFTNSGKKAQDIQPQNQNKDNDDDEEGWITVGPGKR